MALEAAEAEQPAELALPPQEAPEEAEQPAVEVALEAVMVALQAVHQASKSVMLVEVASLVIPVEDVVVASLVTSVGAGWLVVPSVASVTLATSVTPVISTTSVTVAMDITAGAITTDTITIATTCATEDRNTFFYFLVSTIVTRNELCFTLDSSSILLTNSLLVLHANKQSALLRKEERSAKHVVNPGFCNLIGFPLFV